MSKIKIGLGQLLVEGGEPERNLERAIKMIEQASQLHCDIVLLPETLDFAWTHTCIYNEAETIPGKYSNVLCASARENNIFVCAGLTEKLNGKIFNSAILINRNGDIILKYHKINLLEVEQPFYAIGQTLNVVDTEFGKIGVNICADNYKNGLPIGHTLARMGAQIILSPSSWTVDYSVNETNDPYNEKWIKPYTRLSQLYNIVVVGTTSVGYIISGPYEGKKSIGCSLAVGPKGIIAQGAFNEFASDLIVTEFELLSEHKIGTELGDYIEKQGVIF